MSVVSWCRYCGSPGSVTREHLPAKSAGNRRFIAEVGTSENAGPDTEEWPDGFALPALCDTCNGNGSSWKFTEEYRLWRDAAIESLQRYCVAQGRTRPARLIPGEEIELRLDYDRMPGRFSRSVVGMFLAAQATERLLVTHSQLAATVTAGPGGEPPGPTDIRPARLFLALANRDTIIPRDTAHLVRVGLTSTTDSGLLLPQAKTSQTPLLLMVVPPFAFTLLLGGNPPEGAGIEITHWTERGHHDRVDRAMRRLLAPVLEYEWIPSAKGALQ